mgnify:CR=1 FL=1|tara:strand:- start:1574 stop:1678 length:105 start_codon:yes stop_codon:yes gene_type:complete
MTEKIKHTENYEEAIERAKKMWARFERRLEEMFE